MRLCRVCHVDISDRHGNAAKCIDCSPKQSEKKKSKQREWYQHNRDEYLPKCRHYQNERYNTDPEYRQKVRAYNLDYKQRDEVRERTRQFHRDRRAAIGYLSNRVGTLELLWNRQNLQCGLCGGCANIDELEIDHVVPWQRMAEFGLTRETYHLLDNMLAVHSNCNKRKWKWVPTDNEWPEDLNRKIGLFSALNVPISDTLDNEPNRLGKGK